MFDMIDRHYLDVVLRLIRKQVYGEVTNMVKTLQSPLPDLAALSVLPPLTQSYLSPTGRPL